MPSDTEVKEFWGAEQLMRWPDELLVARGFSEDDRLYLRDVGLPSVNDWSWEVGSRVADLPVLSAKERLVIVAYDTQVVPICVDLSGEGKLWAIEDELSKRFVNSSVRQFGGCLLQYRRLAYFDRTGAAEENARICKDFHRAVAEIDPGTLLKPDHYWASIVLQINEGMM